MVERSIFAPRVPQSSVRDRMKSLFFDFLTFFYLNNVPTKEQFAFFFKTKKALVRLVRKATGIMEVFILLKLVP